MQPLSLLQCRAVLGFKRPAERHLISPDGFSLHTQFLVYAIGFLLLCMRMTKSRDRESITVTAVQWDERRDPHTNHIYKNCIQSQT